MRITDTRCETIGDRTRVLAHVVWEDTERTETLWYEWPSSFAAEIFPAAAAALVSALPLAVVTGERRVTIDAPVCAFLYDHLRNVLGLFGAWFPKYATPTLEVVREKSTQAPTGDRRAAFCLSGGVDSLAAFVENHTSLADGHPERFRDGLFLFGLNTYDFADGSPVATRVAWYQEYASRLERYADATGIELISIATNVRSLYADWMTWANVGQASVLAAAAHAMPGRIHALTIAGGGAGADGSISGTEPGLDPLYSSYSLDVRTVHGTVSRFEKVRMLAHHQPSLDVLRVCFTFDVPVPGSTAINCGQCEKCIRTMLTLLACGALDRVPTFPSQDVTTAQIDALVIEVTARRQMVRYRELVGPLRERGRDDLARALTKRLDVLERRENPPSVSLLRRIFRG